LKKSHKIALLIILVLLIDQAVKIWIKTNMEYGDEIKIFGLDWARIHFVENEGMAFGLELPGSYGKLALSLFRLLAVGALFYYLHLLVKANAPFGLLASFGLILAGALGNIIDSAFYGMIFSNSSFHGGLATLFPEGGGYAGFLHGRVVDMFYFPIYEGYFPDWMPFWGGEYFQFFRPVFNVADASITIGVFSLLLFNRKFFSSHSIEDLQKQSAGEVVEESEMPTNEELATAPQSLTIEPNPDQESAKES
jgi:signal peptidase II